MARIPAAVVSLAVAAYFGWRTWHTWQALQVPPASAEQALGASVALAVYAVGTVVHFLIAVALIIETAIGRRSRRWRRAPTASETP